MIINERDLMAFMGQSCGQKTACKPCAQDCDMRMGFQRGKIKSLSYANQGLTNLVLCVPLRILSEALCNSYITKFRKEGTKDHKELRFQMVTLDSHKVRR